jgi:23S rRNA (adenine2030-N6)-methyltransferase
MNYRHQFHAGNFADVMKHVLLIQLVRALQQKPKGFLYLDTHAGRGRYDLAAADRGDSLARAPEWPDGIGRVWTQDGLAGPLQDYVELVRQFDREHGNGGASPRFYPGSPWIARLLARPEDRLALCEKHPAEHAALAEEFIFSPNPSVQAMDGYVGVRAMLPPRERRALVLIDPPFETPDEFAQIARALRESLGRLPGGVVAVWYPLTERARLEAFFGELRMLPLPPTLTLELTVAGEQSPLKLRGCGLLVVNPPWQFDRIAQPALRMLGDALALAPGGGGELEWLVPES